MSAPTSLNKSVIETLYGEALILADEARGTFDLTQFSASPDGETNALRLALSIEGLRATTRIMHVLAWLLNHRAFFAGEMTLDQLRRHALLPPDRPSDPENMALLPPHTRAVIDQSERIHAQIVRLDAAERKNTIPPTPAVHQLTKYLEENFA